MRSGQLLKAQRILTIGYNALILGALIALAGGQILQSRATSLLLDNQYAVAAIQDVQSQMIVRNMKDLDTARIEIGRLNRMLSITSLD